MTITEALAVYVTLSSQPQSMMIPNTKFTFEMARKIVDEIASAAINEQRSYKECDRLSNEQPDPGVLRGERRCA